MGEEETIQGRGYRMSKETEMISMECAEKLPQGIGFEMGVAQRGLGHFWILGGQVKKLIFSRRQQDEKASV